MYKYTIGIVEGIVKQICFRRNSQRNYGFQESMECENGIAILKSKGILIGTVTEKFEKKSEKLPVKFPKELPREFP